MDAVQDSFESVVLVEGIEYIPRRAFSKNSRLRISATVTSIGEKVFAHCSELSHPQSQTQLRPLGTKHSTTAHFPPSKSSHQLSPSAGIHSLTAVG